MSRMRFLSKTRCRERSTIPAIHSFRRTETTKTSKCWTVPMRAFANVSAYKAPHALKMGTFAKGATEMKRLRCPGLGAHDPRPNSTISKQPPRQVRPQHFLLQVAQTPSKTFGTFAVCVRLRAPIRPRHRAHTQAKRHYIWADKNVQFSDMAVIKLSCKTNGLRRCMLS